MNKKLLMLIVTWSLTFLFCSENVPAQTLGAQQQRSEKPRQEVLFSENGRFIFGQISDSSKDQFMLDTLTGRLWRIAETGEIGMFLRAIPYRNDEGEMTYVPEKIPD
ncbi:MAG: hypothetical protein JW896_12095 [Deltaproteobacteria bacterium]|nr:hypothetical protein [Deltaproteobacteria bacterium]